jgi:hypothetical protein
MRLDPLIPPTRIGEKAQYAIKKYYPVSPNPVPFKEQDKSDNG